MIGKAMKKSSSHKEDDGKIYTNAGQADTFFVKFITPGITRSQGKPLLIY